MTEKRRYRTGKFLGGNAARTLTGAARWSRHFFCLIATRMFSSNDHSISGHIVRLPRNSRENRSRFADFVCGKEKGPFRGLDEGVSLGGSSPVGGSGSGRQGIAGRALFVVMFSIYGLIEKRQVLIEKQSQPFYRSSLRGLDTGADRACISGWPEPAQHAAHA